MTGGIIDIGVITGSGIEDLSESHQMHRTGTPYGEVDVATFQAGPWRVGSISRHGAGHYHLPHTIPHRANLLALQSLGARAVLAVTVVGAVDTGLPLGRPVLFDDLYFPDNRLPNGEPCTIFPEPGEAGRGHLILDEPFSPRLREKVSLAADKLGIEVNIGGVYAHTNGPRFETKAEIGGLDAVGVSAVSQTCGPEAILAGELGISYCLIGFPVNYATGKASPEPKEDLDRRLALASRVLPRLVLGAAEKIEEEDFVLDHGYVYRFE